MHKAHLLKIGIVNLSRKIGGEGVERLENIEINYCKVGERFQLRIAIKQPGNKGLNDSAGDSTVFCKEWTKFSKESSGNGKVIVNDHVGKVNELLKLLTVELINLR